MKRKIFLGLSFFGIISMFTAQTYPPQAGQPGSTAIHKDDAAFVAWATGCTVVRGVQQIDVTGSPNTTSGDPNNVIGQASNSIVSLGDGGSAIVTFAKPIMNGAGADFAIFENGFISNFTGRAFLELAFVEVSSDGVNYFRFPAVNQYPADFIQNTSDDPGGSGFATMDARYLHNFASKYIVNYGTPFDLDEIPENPLLNKNAITHVKIIDVVGTNQLPHRTYDSLGNVAIDPFPTPFPTGGFDLDAVGVIHENTNLAISEAVKSELLLFPNPAVDFLTIKSNEKIESWKLYSISGQQILQGVSSAIDVKRLAPGTYLLQIISGGKTTSHKILKK